ncbi:MAG TPA: hypothetical protein VL633_14025 [Bacteroidota bacterium]|jgi:hypothetical protein|nr:hypothetical protein [Bacteroidota bacterium]
MKCLIQKSLIIFPLLGIALFATSCRKGEAKTDPGHSLSPNSINLAGLTFYQTHSQLSSQLNMLRCSSTDPIIKKCRWSTTRRDREGAFKGIEEIQFTLYRDSVQSISITYTPMLDVEFKKFDQAIQQKYATVAPDPHPDTPDTITTEWVYDSLIVKLMPNKKRHWTGRMYTYTPVLEFQERMLYQRWIADVEKQTVVALY